MKTTRVTYRRMPRALHTAWLGTTSAMVTGLGALVTTEPTVLLWALPFAGAGVLMDRRGASKVAVGRGVTAVRRADRAIGRIEAIGQHVLATDSLYVQSLFEARSAREALVAAASELAQDEAARSFPPKVMKQRWKEVEGQARSLDELADSLAGLLEERRHLNAVSRAVDTGEERARAAARNIDEARLRVVEEVHATRDTRRDLEEVARDLSDVTPVLRKEGGRREEA